MSRVGVSEMEDRSDKMSRTRRYIDLNDTPELKKMHAKLRKSRHQLMPRVVTRDKLRGSTHPSHRGPCSETRGIKLDQGLIIDKTP